MINRLQPKEKTTITVTAKQDKEEDANVPLTAFVSGNLSYQIILKAKFVVPDLSLSTDTLDFQSIKRGEARQASSSFSGPEKRICNNFIVLLATQSSFMFRKTESLNRLR